MIIQLNVSNGLSIDLNPSVVPLNFCTDARNVHFEGGYVKKGRAWSDVAQLPVEPYGLWSVSDPSKTFLVAAGLQKVYAVLGSNAYNITRQSSGVDVDYTGSSTDYWTATILNGIPIFNNGADVPQAWTTLDVGTRLINLPNWPSNHRAKVIRAFKNYLVALNVNGDQRMVKWSHSAPPGELPSSWDPSDATKEAGEKSLGEGEDKLVDCLPLGDFNVIYGEASMTAMRLAPLPFVFSFIGISKVAGALTVDCVKEFNGVHFVVTGDDVVVFNGRSIESVAEGRVRRWLFSNIEPQSMDTVRVVPNYRSSEMWVVFPPLGSSVLSMAAVWNWKYNTWSVLDNLPNFRCVAQQMFAESGAAGMWETDTGTWGSDSQSWSGETPVDSVVSGRTLGGTISPQKSIKFYDYSKPANGKSVVERIAIDASVNRDGEVVRDPTRRRLLTSVWPQVHGTGITLKIQAGSHDKPGGPVSWSPTSIFNCSGQVGSEKVDLYREGRYLAVRMVDESDKDWELVSLGIDVATLGML